jgi:formate--tetrahydrofolate ligase
MEEINLFFNGDFPAITAAHNLLSAMIDNSLHNGNACGLETGRIAWLRATDMIDRSLRDIVIGLGEGNGPVRSEHFVITPASEVMAILCLANSLEDLQRRLDHIIVGMRSDGSPATAKDVGASNAMAVLLKDALRPNLVQTVEGGPALMHGGPFGNIAHGCSSMLSTRCALGLADYAVTEAGFGSDLGGEKFLNIVAPQLGKLPDAIVLVASLRALQHHGAGNLEIGWANLLRHYDHLKRYGPPVVVAINRFSEDTRRELGELHKLADSSGLNAVECNPWNGGGEGCLDLAIAVRSEAEKESAFETIYQWSDSIPTKLQKLVTKVYGGQGVEFSRTAQRHLTWIENHGYGELPICVAKTQYSLSDEPLKLGAPEGFDLHVRELKVSAGAGFIVAVCGDVLLMPGMGKDPAAAHIGIDSAGRITGMH